MGSSPKVTKSALVKSGLGARLGYRMAELADLVGCHVDTVRTEVREGRLPAVKLPGAKGPNAGVIILHEDAVAWWNNWDDRPVKVRGEVTYPVALVAKMIGVHHSTLYRHLDCSAAGGIPTERDPDRGQIVVRHDALVAWLDQHREVREVLRPVARRRLHATAGASDPAGGA